MSLSLWLVTGRQPPAPGLRVAQIRVYVWQPKAPHTLTPWRRFIRHVTAARAPQ